MNRTILEQQRQLTISDSEKGLENKVNSITRSLSRPHFRNSLIKLSKNNFENASIICNYIISEENEFNIKRLQKKEK